MSTQPPQEIRQAQPAEPGPPRRVLSIVGAGRSGSTIVSSILGQVPGVFAAGELRWLWARDLVQQRLCECGERPSACPVWSQVVELSLGVLPPEQHPEALAAAVSEVVAAQQQVSAARNRPRLLTTPGTGDEARRRLDPALVALTSATTSVLDALAEVTGAHTIVDASKRPQEAAVLAAAPGVEHHVLHMVRDPRAVVWSWRRAKPLPASTGREAMGTRSQRRTLMRWVENAAGAEVLRRHVPPERWLFVRYEDFAAAPRTVLRQVLHGLLELPEEPPFTADDTVVLQPGHTLSGNPSRFRTGPVRIVADQEWSQHMSRRDQAVVEAATWPFLLRYGYPLLGRRPDAALGAASGSASGSSSGSSEAASSR